MNVMKEEDALLSLMSVNGSKGSTLHYPLNKLFSSNHISSNPFAGQQPEIQLTPLNNVCYSHGLERETESRSAQNKGDT